MEGTHVFDRFIALVKFDQETIAIKKKIDALEKETGALKANLATLNENLDTARQLVQTAQKEVQLQELRMQELDSKEKEKRKQLETTSSPKEYTGIKKEVEHLQHAQHAYESELVDSWNKLENAKAAFALVATEIETGSAAIQTEIAHKETELSALRAEFRQQEQLRQEKLKDIPEEWLTKYDVMHLRVSNPVVPVYNNCCSACFEEIPQVDLTQLARRKMMQCKGCFRLLYLAQA